MADEITKAAKLYHPHRAICGQSCPCCRAENPEDKLGTCPICHLAERDAILVPSLHKYRKTPATFSIAPYIDCYYIKGITAI